MSCRFNSIPYRDHSRQMWGIRQGNRRARPFHPISDYLLYVPNPYWDHSRQYWGNPSREPPGHAKLIPQRPSRGTPNYHHPLTDTVWELPYGKPPSHVGAPIVEAAVSKSPAQFDTSGGTHTENRRV